MNTFNEKLVTILSDFGKGRKMVLSTSCNDVVSSRMMSVVLIDKQLYFQTDITFRKYNQLASNPHVALCTDNIQIEGIAEELGHPLTNTEFCRRFEDCFKGSFDAYTSLSNERLFRVAPSYIQRWIYIDGVPYIETLDICQQQYQIRQYKGE